MDAPRELNDAPLLNRALSARTKGSSLCFFLSTTTASSRRIKFTSPEEMTTILKQFRERERAEQSRAEQSPKSKVVIPVCVCVSLFSATTFQDVKVVAHISLVLNSLCLSSKLPSFVH